MSLLTTLQENPSGYELYRTNIPHWPIFALADSPEFWQIVLTVLGGSFDGFFKLWNVGEKAWVSTYYHYSPISIKHLWSAR